MAVYGPIPPVKHRPASEVRPDDQWLAGTEVLTVTAVSTDRDGARVWITTDGALTRPYPAGYHLPVLVAEVVAA